MKKTKELFEDLLVEPRHCLLLAHRVHIQVDQIGHLEIVTTVTLQESSEPEAQKPKTFRVASFYAQKLSGRSARNRFSRQA